jgi:protein disulfide-isomerase
MLLVVSAGSLAAVEADIDGATPGKWTMDLDAAKKLAAERQLPILLDFSGSDWCGWCKIMEENVFTKPEWKTYAKENLVMVLLDYPRDKSLIPEKYIERNKALKAEYGVTGYPTFVVLDDDGETELGRLRSGRDKTPESFQTELKNLFRFRPAEIEKYIATLSPDDRAAYLGLSDQLAAEKVALELGEKAVTDARAKVGQLNRSVKAVEIKMREFRIGQLDEDERKQYDALRARNATIKGNLQEWIKTKPEQNEENKEKYKAMQTELQEIEKKILQY